MTTKRTMTLNLTDAEMDVLEGLCAVKELSKTAVIRQALRIYQMIELKSRNGQKLFFENETTKEKAEMMIL